MSRIPQRVNRNWTTEPGSSFTWEQAICEVLMDIRAELVEIKRHTLLIEMRLSCAKTVGIPSQLERIARNTAKPRKTKATP